MRTTIDGAGRIVVPKAIRDAMGLDAGRAVDVTFADGRIEIEVAPVEIDIVPGHPFPKAVPREPLPPLTDDMVRHTLDEVRQWPR